MQTALNAIAQTENLDYLVRHARYYTNSAKAFLENLRKSESTDAPKPRGDLKKSLQFCLGERRWARRALLARTH